MRQSEYLAKSLYICRLNLVKVMKYSSKHMPNYQKLIIKRKRYGDTREIARRTGYHEVSISRMLHGKRTMPEVVYVAFLELFNERNEHLTLKTTYYDNQNEHKSSSIHH